ncbi:MAG: VWA domain-containing protein [Planctomycetaceae bacterium]|jgi:hypothetical protein|nr:VWA domain-containing protein [Planctomycetaceae bacterium]
MQNTDIADTIFRWGRIQNNSDWLPPVLVLILLVLYFIRRYRIDASEIKSWKRWLLFALRTAALAALLLYYLHPQWEHLIASSRVVVTVDTSASMGNRDADEKTRLNAAVDWLQQSGLIKKLSEKHEVVTLAFSDSVQEVKEGIESLKPGGNGTAIGEALFETLQRERGQPLAGIIMISDGSQNTGRSLDSPLETAERLRIPIYPVGVGQLHPPLNYRVGNLNLPERAVPGDPFILKVPVEMIGGEASQIKAELLLNDKKIDEKTLAFEADGSVETSFNVKIEEAGKYRLAVKIMPLEKDLFPEDNQQQAEVNVVDRKDRVLLFAAAPNRDYQFLCSQIFRDKTMSVDVYLPWAQRGISQNADKILEKFPMTRNEMAEYDVVIAFDPNWRDLSQEQIDILEFWVARQGGGLILFAGGIQMQDTVTGWVNDPGMDKIRALYPVEFLIKQSAFEHRYHGGTTVYPLKFSRAGETAEFLQPDGESGGGANFWSRFAGFYGFFAVKGIKPTATLLASTGSPEINGKEESGTLIAEQFYGAGRVIYFGSSELWRLRKTDEKAYEQIAAKIVRYVAQGRLQRESDRGTLALDKQRYSIGSTAQIRITANDPQLNPLTLPSLPVELQTPSGTLRMIDVSLDPNVPGAYQAFVPLDTEGTWSVQWTIPETEQKIIRTAQVQMSDLERENPNRNEALLRETAEKSGGVYFADFTSAEKLPEMIHVRSQRAVMDEAVDEKIGYYLLIAVCALLMVEWTLRRLMQLA